MITRAKSGIRKPKTIWSLDTSIVGLESTSFKKAFKDSKWKEAMAEEYNALVANET